MIVIAGYTIDLTDTQRSMAIWLNNAGIHDNNFKWQTENDTAKRSDPQFIKVMLDSTLNYF